MMGYFVYGCFGFDCRNLCVLNGSLVPIGRDHVMRDKTTSDAPCPRNPAEIG